jgi:hypothetical protein
VSSLCIPYPDCLVDLVSQRQVSRYSASTSQARISVSDGLGLTKPKPCIIPTHRMTLITSLSPNDVFRHIRITEALYQTHAHAKADWQPIPGTLESLDSLPSHYSLIAFANMRSNDLSPLETLHQGQSPQGAFPRVISLHHFGGYKPSSAVYS